MTDDSLKKAFTERADGKSVNGYTVTVASFSATAIEQIRTGDFRQVTRTAKADKPASSKQKTTS